MQRAGIRIPPYDGPSLAELIREDRDSR